MLIKSIKISIYSKKLHAVQAEEYATLTLPASKKEIEAAMDQVHVQNMQDCGLCDLIVEKANSYLRVPLEEIDLESANIYEVNFLTEKLMSLEKDQIRNYTGALQLYRPKTIKDAINLTANCNHIHIVGDIKTENELGKFLYENELSEVLPRELSGLSTIGFKEYDYTHIAREHLGENAKITDIGYIEDDIMESERKEIYDGQHLPEQLAPSVYQSFEMQ